MSYHEEERTRLRRQSSKLAISLAMEGRWQEAVAANKSLLESFPNDVDAYNRLGRAYMELGDYLMARNAYTRAQELDPYNTIAQKNLDRLSRLGEPITGIADSFHRVEPQHFIEEVGKAGIVNLYHTAPPEILAKMVAGDEVSLKVVGLNLIAENKHGEYLGQVDPKHGQRLARLMEGGNQYIATIISTVQEVVTIIIREAYQHPSQAGRLSFPPKGVKSYRTYVDDRIIRRGIEQEESLPGEPAYTIIGGEEGEFLSEESGDIDDETEDEE